MYHALWQDDIIASVVTQVDSNDSLASLARTSHAWSTPALDKLWSTNTINITHLARCMPTRYWKEVEKFKDPYFESNLILRKRRRTGEWLGLRFLRYAARIRFLSTEDWKAERQPFTDDQHRHGGPLKKRFRWPYKVKSACATAPKVTQVTCLMTYHVHAEILAAWRVYSHDLAAIFSRLEVLRWNIQDIDYVGDDIGSFLVPSLRELVLTSHYAVEQPVNGSPEEYEGYLRALHSHESLTATISRSAVHKALSLCPSLRTLVVLPTSAFESMEGLDFSILRSVVFSWDRWIPNELLRCLMILPNLEHLQGTLRNDIFASSTISMTLPSTAFPSLRALHIGGISVQDATQLIRAIMSPLLEIIGLYNYWDLADSWMSHPNLLQTLATHRSIKHLYLQYKEIKDDFDVGSDLLKLDVTPILELSQLRCLMIVGHTIDLAMTPLWRLFLAWKDLEYLDVTCRGVWGPMSLSDFNEALRYAAPSFRLLRGLWIECDLFDIPSHGRTLYPNINFLNFLIRHNPNLQISRGPLIHYLMSTFPSVDLMEFGARWWDDTRSILLAFGARRARKAGHPWTLKEFNENDSNAYRSGIRQLETPMLGFTALWLYRSATSDTVSSKLSILSE